MAAITSRARNQIATKPSQRFETPTVECPRGGDVRKYASAEERAAKNQKTTVRHFGFTEKVYGLPFSTNYLATQHLRARFARQRRQCRSGGRCCRVRLMRNCIEVTIATGNYKESDVFLPRIPLIPSGANIPFEFKRLQFPVRVCFAMSINKAHGQSLTVAGLYLQAPCFTWAVLCWVLTAWHAK